MNILILSGHGYSNKGKYDPGALGTSTNEATQTVRVARDIASLLNSKGVKTNWDDKNTYQNLADGNNKINFKNYDYVLEIHFNAFNKQARGTEIFVTHREQGTGVEKAIINELGKIFINRGVKRRDFMVINYIKNMGVSSALLEVCFIDNQSDMIAYNNNYNKVIEGIVKGIITGFSIKGTKEVVKQESIKPTTKPAKPFRVKPIGELVNIIGTHYSTGEVIPGWVKKRKGYKVIQSTPTKALLSPINSWVNHIDLE